MITKVKVTLILLLALLAMPAPSYVASTKAVFSLDFLSNIAQGVGQFFTASPKDRIKVETNLAQSALNQLSALTSPQAAGPILDDYTHHLEKAVALSSKLDASSRSEVAPEIANVIQSSTPIIIGEAGNISNASNLSKLVATNQWAANKITNPTSLPTAGPINISTLSTTPRTSALKKAVDAQAKALVPTASKTVPPPLPPAFSVHVPILMYHYVRVVDAGQDPLGYALSVTPSDLDAQMAYLEANGFHTIHPAQLVSAIKNKTALPSKSIILTFDDSYRDFYTAALPILQRHHFVASNYVITDYVLNANPAYMTPDMVKEIDRDGMNVAAHTKGHPDLARLSVTDALEQIRGSKAALEALIGKPVLDFAYPYGSFNWTTVSLVARAGFTDASTTIYGTYHSLANILTLTRVRISGGDSVATFANKVNQ